MTALLHFKSRAFRQEPLRVDGGASPDVFPLPRAPHMRPLLSSRFPRPLLIWQPNHVDAVNGLPFSVATTSSSSVASVRPWGRSDLFRSGDSWLAPWIPYFAPPATVLALVNFSGVQTGTLFSAGGAGAGLGWRVGCANVGGTMKWSYTAGGIADNPSSLSLVDAVDYCVGFRLPATNTYDVVVDGRFLGSTARNAPSASAHVANIAGANGGTTSALGGDLGLVVVWNLALDVGMLAELTRNPWQVFDRRAFVFYTPSATFNPAWAVSANSVIQPGAIAA